MAPKLERIRSSVINTAVIAAAWIALRVASGEGRLPPMTHVLKWSALAIFCISILELFEIDMTESVPAAGKAAVSTKLLHLITATT